MDGYPENDTVSNDPPKVDNEASRGLIGLGLLAMLIEITQLLLLPVLYCYDGGVYGRSPCHLLFALPAIILPVVILFCGVGMLLHVVEAWLLRLSWISRRRGWVTLFILAPCLIPGFGCFYFFILLLFLAIHGKQRGLVFSAMTGLLLVTINAALCWSGSALNRQINLDLGAYTGYILLCRTLFYLIVLHAIWRRKEGTFTRGSLRFTAVCLGLIVGINLGFGVVCWRAQQRCRHLLADFPGGSLEIDGLADRYYHGLPAEGSGLFYHLAELPPLSREARQSGASVSSVLPQPERRLSMLQLWSSTEDLQALSAWCSEQHEFFAEMDAISAGRLYKHPRDYTAPAFFLESRPEHRAYTQWNRLYRLRLVEALGRGDGEAAMRLWRLSAWACRSALDDDDSSAQTLGASLWNGRLDMLEMCLSAGVFSDGQWQEIQPELVHAQAQWGERIQRLYSGEAVRWAVLFQSEMLNRLLQQLPLSKIDSAFVFDRHFVVAHFGSILLAYTHQLRSGLLQLLHCASRQAAQWPDRSPCSGRYSGNMGKAIVQATVQMQQVLQQVQQRQAATLGALAVRRYQLANGRLPASLAQLVPDYLEAIPLDMHRQELRLLIGDFPVPYGRWRVSGEAATGLVRTFPGYQVQGSVVEPLLVPSAPVGEGRRRGGFSIKPDVTVLNLKGE